jgi:hypothetical protein
MSKTLLRHTLIKNIFDIFVDFLIFQIFFYHLTLLFMQDYSYTSIYNNKYLKRHLYLRNRLLDQSYKKIRFCTFWDRDNP